MSPYVRASAILKGSPSARMSQVVAASAGAGGKAVGRAGRRQAIAVPVHGVDEARVVRVGLDLLPQPRDRVVDRPRARDVEIAPHLAQQLAPVDDALPALGQVLEQLQLAVREVQRAA